jgi:DNA-binding transcriptional ArsR family regulator
MSALAQETRLRVYQILVEALPDGMPASEVAESVGMTRNGMSAHFAILTAAGLLTSEKIGRNVIYRAETFALRELTTFLSRAIDRDPNSCSGQLTW